MPRKKGFKHSEETIEKIRKSNKGKVRSMELRKKLSIIAKKNGNRPPSRLGIPHTEDVKKRISDKEKGRIFTKEHLEKISGENCHFWKGGVTALNDKIKTTFEYKQWRRRVFEKDNYTCVWCGDNKGGNLQADHIKPQSLFPQFRFTVDNGRTLCRDCHKKTDAYGYKVKYYKEQI